MRELAIKAMKKSGNRFYDNMQKMTHAHLKLKDTISLTTSQRAGFVSELMGEERVLKR